MEVMLFKKPAAQEESRRSAADHPAAAAAAADEVESMKEAAAGKGDQLESTKAEMGEIREENERLKMILSRIVKDYQSLQMHFFDIVHQEQAKKPVDQLPTAPSPNNSEEESELVSLSLGTSSSSGHRKEDKTNATKTIKDSTQKFEDQGLALGLDCKYEGSANTSLNETVSNRSPDNSFDQEAKDEEPGEAWPPSKVLKGLRTGDDEIAQQQPQAKKARVSIRARCDAPTMNDGCQWRKYGQKVAKGNPCPRAYYRCTVAPSCPVRKQVQRCADDLSILITTYEGTHNHPLPVSATAIASTTSAAASMLLAGSSSSQPLAIDALASSSASAAGATLHGLNFSLSDASRTRPYYQLHNTSISSTPSYPTITLDLTTPPSSGGSHANQFSRFSAGFAGNAPRYTSTNFNFSSSETNSLPLSWSNGSYLNYGSGGGGSSQQYNRSPLGSLSLSRLSQEPFCQSFLQKTPASVSAASGTNSHAFTDTIAKALSSDPTFQSALAEAISSYVGAHGAQSSAPTGNACAASLLNRSTGSSGNSQLQGNMLFLQPSLAFPGTKSASASPVDNHRESTN